MEFVSFFALLHNIPITLLRLFRHYLYNCAILKNTMIVAKTKRFVIGIALFLQDNKLLLNTCKIIAAGIACSALHNSSCETFDKIMI